MTTKTRQPRLRLDALEDRAVPASLTNFFTNQHADLNVTYTAGTNSWLFQPRDHETEAAFDPADALLYVGTPAAATRPAGAAFDFLGVPAGGTYYKLPQDQDPDLLYLGLAAEGVTAADFDRFSPAADSKGRVSGVSRWVRVSLVDVRGPGEVALWQSGETEPVVLLASHDDGVSNPNGSGLDTTDGLSADDSAWTLAGGHLDYNWGFTQKGRYELTFKLTGYTPDGNDNTRGTPFESPPITVYVSVGNVGRLEFDAGSNAVDENAETATLTVRRVGGSDGQLTVDYATGGGTATPGTDYTAASGTLTFADGETAKTVVVPLTNDSADEPDETVVVTLSNPGPASLAGYLSGVEGAGMLAANAAATLAIRNDDSPVGNTPPTISDVPDQSTPEDTPTAAIAVTVGDTQSALNDLTLTATSSDQALVPDANIVVGGTGAGRTVTITPAANRSGAVTITLTVRDTGGLTATDSFVLTVTPANDPPAADAKSVSTRQDESAGVTLTGSDIDGDDLTFAVATQPQHGTLSGAAPTLTYTPNPGYVGPDSFTYTAADATATSAPATVSINVTPARAPVPGADAFELSPGNVLRGNLLANDADPDGDPVTAAVLTNPQHGTLSLNADGSFTYTPDGPSGGTDSFTYTVSDNTGRSATGTVSIAAAAARPLEAVLTEGHTDVGIAYEAGAWEPHVHSEAADAEFEPDGALLFVGPQARRPRPADAAFDFLGVAGGDPIWQLPHSPPNPELLRLGIGTEEIEPGTFADGKVRLRLVGVNGPGQFAVWRTTDDGPEVFMATADGVSAADTFTGLTGGHADLNWGFTAKGRYEVTVQPWGFLDDGNADPDFGPTATYVFSVDNLGQVTFERTDYGTTEGKTVAVTVRRVGGRDGPVTVAYATAPGTATAADFTAASGELVFGDLETEKTFTVTTLKDRRAEPVETFTAALTVPAGSAAELGQHPTATLAIDTPGALKVVGKLRVNDGAAQRSNIESLSVKFSRDTNLPTLIAAGIANDAVKLFVGGTEVVLDPSRFHYSTSTRTLTIGLTEGGFDPRTRTLLANGQYELRLDTTKVMSLAGGVTLADDRVADGVYRLGFHRLLGDLNGDGKLTMVDLGVLKRNLNVYQWQRRYNYAFDLAGGPTGGADGVIDQTDLTYLQSLIAP